MTMPDRLCADKSSPFYDEHHLSRGVNVIFKGVERKNDVVEYCISEGWIRVHMRDRAGNFMVSRRTGNAVAMMLRGPVEVSFKRPA